MYKEVLTDPKQHDSNNFIYLVHGIMDHSGLAEKKVLTRYDVEQKINRIKDPEGFYRGSLIGRLEAETAKEKIHWHGGPVSQTATFGNQGLILDPSSDDIVYIAWNCDLGSPWQNGEFKEWIMQHKGKKKDPLDLLTHSVGPSWANYNEMALRGDPATNVSGVFYVDLDDRAAFEGRLLQEMVSVLKGQDVPIIALPNPNIGYYGMDELMRDLDREQGGAEKMQALYEFKHPERDRRFGEL
jgi:hypothetical protein|tara:strand:+ start:168 stop:890 length:723 start_codon:yes stop_codon:yes gene_type:complete